MTVREKQHRPLPITAPWWKNSVRRRWTRIVFAAITFVATILAVVDIEPATMSHWPVQIHLPSVIGCLALPLLYPLTQRLGGSRYTALWAMGFMAGSLVWLWGVRDSGWSGVLPLFTTLALLSYLWLQDSPRWWPPILACAALVGGVMALNRPLAALAVSGVLLGLGLHALLWGRQRLGPRTAVAATWLLVLALVLFGFFRWAYSDLRPVPSMGLAAANAVVLLFVWITPLLLLPLLHLALFNDPKNRWRPDPHLMILPLTLFCSVLVICLTPVDVRLETLLGILPVAILWMAIGFTRLQGRTSPWLWVPMGILLVLTTLPQGVISWGIRATHLHERITETRGTQGISDDRDAARRSLWWNLQQPLPGLLVPLYPLVVGEISDTGFPSPDEPPAPFYDEPTPAATTVP